MWNIFFQSELIQGSNAIYELQQIFMNNIHLRSLCGGVNITDNLTIAKNLRKQFHGSQLHKLVLGKLQ